MNQRNSFISFKIMPLLFFGCLKCILMEKYNIKNVTKNIVYSNIPKFMKIQYKIKLVRYSFYN